MRAEFYGLVLAVTLVLLDADVDQDSLLFLIGGGIIEQTLFEAEITVFGEAPSFVPELLRELIRATDRGTLDFSQPGQLRGELLVERLEYAVAFRIGRSKTDFNHHQRPRRFVSRPVLLELCSNPADSGRQAFALEL